MDSLDEFYARHPEFKGYRDSEFTKNRELTQVFLDKENEHAQIMNRVAHKYTKWSLARDRFIREEVSYLLEINSGLYTQ